MSLWLYLVWNTLLSACLNDSWRYSLTSKIILHINCHAKYMAKLNQYFYLTFRPLYTTSVFQASLLLYAYLHLRGLIWWGALLAGSSVSIRRASDRGLSSFLLLHGAGTECCPNNISHRLTNVPTENCCAIKAFVSLSMLLSRTVLMRFLVKVLVLLKC